MAFHFHERWCQLAKDGQGRPHEDAVKRLRDNYNLHRIANPHGSVGKWIAARLSDGSSDGVLYDTKLDAVTHQRHNEQWYTFIKIVPSSMTECEAQVCLNTARRLYDNGLRMTDPDHRHGGPEVIKRLSIEDQLSLSRGLVTNVILLPDQRN